MLEARLEQLDRWVVVPLATCAVYGMMTLVSFDVVTRYFTGGSVYFIPPLTVQLGMPVIAYACLSMVAARDGNIRLTLVVGRLPVHRQSVVVAAWSILGAVLFFAVGVGSLGQAARFWTQRQVGVVLPLGIPYAIIAGGCFLGALRVALRAVDPGLRAPVAEQDGEVEGSF